MWGLQFIFVVVSLCANRIGIMLLVKLKSPETIIMKARVTFFPRHGEVVDIEYMH
jgi:hypothetical protein